MAQLSMNGGGLRGVLMAFVLLPLVAVMAAGCSPLARVRTLPPSVRTVYMPMVVNRTGEPGIEERITVAIQEEFLADGRLDLVPERRADAIVQISLQKFERGQGFLDIDDFPTGGLYFIETHMEVRRNIPGRPLIGEPRKLETEFGFNADTRSTAFMPEDVRQNEFARALARQVVLEVLTGDYTDKPLETLGKKPEESGLGLPSF